ncbi:c-type cytochrome [Novosphingobium sp.]|uniref:c-type cytochrome n=1 Tax=Novosphingobium sp. TaxID=1874826 RepID=UPI003BAD0E89
MKRALILAAGIALASTAQAAQKLGEVQAQRSPEQVYAAVCGYCHGKNVGPVIRGRGLPAETVEYMVRHGQNAMPAFRPTEVTPAELKALAAWVQTSTADPKEHGQ